MKFYTVNHDGPELMLKSEFLNNDAFFNMAVISE